MKVVQSEFFPEVVIEPEPKPRGGWPARFRQIALDIGFDWSCGEIGKWLSPLIESFGEEDVERSWKWWCQNVSLIETNAAWISPRSFQKKFAYWRQQARPLE